MESRTRQRKLRARVAIGVFGFFDSQLNLGRAVQSSLECVRQDASTVGYVDADGPISPEEIYRLVGHLDEVDSVVASRWMRGSSGAYVPSRFLTGPLAAFGTSCPAPYCFCLSVTRSAAPNSSAAQWSYHFSRQ